MSLQKNAYRPYLFSVLISLAVLESASALGLKLIGRPIYWTDEQPWKPPRQEPPRTERDPWGAWGVPNTTSRMVGDCYDVEYRFNSVGARDEERQIGSAARWIVLGDSGIDGYGLAENERLTNLLEKTLGWEFANFGSSGDFGPLQYLLVYKLLAKRFEHHGVIVGFTLFNDFTDNDAEWWKLHRNLPNQERYRPYSVLAPDARSYSIIYGANGDAKPRDDYNTAPFVEEAPPAAQISMARSLGRRLSKVAATFSLLRQLSSQRTESELHGLQSNWGGFTDDRREITIAKRALDDLAREIGNRPKVLLLLQLRADLVERRRRGADYSAEVKRFFADLRSDGWTIIDTAPAMSLSDDITLGCDDHSNATTERRVADLITMHYRDLLTGKVDHVDQ
jgi:hypothetical protein